MTRALITGITGQDGAYLSKLLLDQGYEVYGAQRRSASANTWRLREMGIENQIQLVPAEMLEFGSVLRVLEAVRPDEIYNLAAQSFVASSFDQPLYTSEVNALGVARILEAIRIVNSEIRFYQASTSEMFGKVQEWPQTERTPFYPRSPYGVSKLYAHWLTVNYRESYGIHASSGILFNHESPLRGLEFVSRKITAGLAMIRAGQQDVLKLGNLEPRRDWGPAEDYVRGMWLMLQQPEPDDYLLATGTTHSVREFAELAASIAGFSLEWVGEGIQLRAIDTRSGHTIIETDPAFYRPSEVDVLCGDATKAKTHLGWQVHVDFEALVTAMVERDLARVEQGKMPL